VCDVVGPGAIVRLWTGELQQLHFYHVGMRIYPPDTPVKTLEISDFQFLDYRINRVANIFEEDGITPPGSQTGAQTINAIVPKGSRKDVFAAAGEKIIESIAMKISAHDMDDVLRKNILNIYFDHASIPQVKAPVGDFFGTAPGLNLYRSLPSYWGNWWGEGDEKIFIDMDRSTRTMNLQNISGNWPGN
jgi:hypothetical protein